MDGTSPQRSDIRLLLVARGVRGFGDGFAAIVLPAYLVAIGFGTVEIGIVAAASLFGSALLTLGVGVVAPRYELRHLLIAGAVLMAATGVMLNVEDLLLIIVVAFIGTVNPSGGDVGMLVPLEQTMLTRDVTDRDRTRVFARYSLVGAMSSAAGALSAAEVIPPKPAGYFNDYAGVVSKEAAQRFNEQLAQFERETSNQVVVAVFPKMQSDSSIEDYTQRVAQAWGVGQKDRRNGAVLFVFAQEHKMYIQVGYGLEGALPDITAFDITEYQIKPHFRSNDYEGGLAAGIDSIIKAIRGEYQGSGKTVRERAGTSGGKFPFSFLFFLFVVIIFFVVPRFSGKRGYRYSGLGGPFIGGWSGGSSGGWSSGGGGGFSGFSGGGGSFGGGGAGSSW